LWHGKVYDYSALNETSPHGVTTVDIRGFPGVKALTLTTSEKTLSFYHQYQENPAETKKHGRKRVSTFFKTAAAAILKINEML
jgi:hypothetical protein